MRNLITIIIPCYNVENYIAECLDSLISQSYRNFEIICVDDGSKDRTAQIIEEYIKKDSRITLYRQSNQFAGVARNNGMKHAKGKYVLFFDGDDFCEKDTLENMVKSAERHSSDIVVCDIRSYDNVTGRYLEDINYLKYSYLKPFEEKGVVSFRDMPEQILMLASSNPQNKLYKREFIEKEGLLFQASRRDNDEYFVLMSMALANKISWTPKKYITYRINNPRSLQGFGEETIDTEDLISTVRALKTGLIEKGRYELLKKSFQNQVLVRYVGLLEGQRCLSNFLKIYTFIKERVFPEFEISEMNPDDMITRVEECQRILSGTAEEYLFWKMKKLQFGPGERYLFPYDCIAGCKKIGIYGAGTVGKAYYRQLCQNSNIQIAGWFDANAKELCNMGMPVREPAAIAPQEMEKIIIAIEEKKTAMAVKKYLLEKGIAEKDIVWSI